MSFINQGKAGFIIGNVFKRAATTGRNAFMDRRFTKQAGNPPPVPPPLYPKAAWLAAYYNRATFELEQESIGVGGHFCTHTADIYSPDHEGASHKFGINEPVWEGFRLGNSLVEINPNPDFATGIDGYSTSQGSLSYVGGKLRWDMINANSFILMEGMNITAGVDYEVTINVNSDKSLRYNVHTQGGFSGNIINGSGVITFTATGTGSLFRLYVLDSIDGSQCDFAKISVKEASGNTYYADDGAGVLLNPLPWLKYQTAASQHAQSYIGVDETFWSNSGDPAIDLGVSEIFPAQNKYAVDPGASQGNSRAFSSYQAASTGTDCLVLVVERDVAERVRIQIKDAVGAVKGDYQYSMLDGSEITESVPCDTFVKEIRAGIFMFILGTDQITAGTNIRGNFFPARGLLGPTIVHYAAVIPDISVNECAELGWIYSVDGVGVATDEIIYNWAEANHDDAGKEYQTNPKLSGEDQVLLSIGGDPVLEVGEAGDTIELSPDVNFNNASEWSRIDPSIVTGSGTATNDGTNGSNAICGDGSIVSTGVRYYYEVVVESIIGGNVDIRLASKLGIGINTPGVHRGIIDTTGGSGSNLDILFRANVVAVLSKCSIQAVAENIIFSDGTNQCSVPVVSPEPRIKAAYGAGGMTLNVDGVEASCPYDGSLSENSGGISTKATTRRLLRIGS